MTDNKVVKGLWSCFFGDCEDCPYKEQKDHDCKDRLIGAAIRVIATKDELIERLAQDINNFSKTVTLTSSGSLTV